MITVFGVLLAAVLVGIWFTLRMKVLLVLAPVVVVLFLVMDSIVIVGAGNRAVIFNKVNGVHPKALGEGIHFVLPLVESVTKFNCRMIKAEFDTTAASKDLQDVATKVALNFHPQADAVAEIYQLYGVDYTEKVVHPAVQEAVKAVTAMYTAEELITKREEVKNRVQEHLSVMMQTAKLTLKETYITNFSFSEGFSHAIESKQIAEQNALKAKRDLDRIRVEAEQKLAGMRAEAEGLRLQKEAITPQLIELRKIDAQKLAIEKWNGVLPVTMMGDTVPFVNVGKKND